MPVQKNWRMQPCRMNNRQAMIGQPYLENYTV